ncbi:LysR family transcriptional regulator [Pararhizobium sp. IMCC21322]|uniref:LysR family transcriptional regulator n=1 Tax=Pararhizobium sp. IMCC21322 TaxID=3067903 RepID=UPI002741D7C5|nr:LysR family transcriptional regulator [Pararhizobium sp. IMCC21322]
MNGNTTQCNVRVELRHLRYVIAAAEHHSFRRAASIVGVHQSAISRRIRDLEEELGASLFNRHSGGVELTFAGEGFLEHARRVVGQIERAASLVNAHGCGNAGIVRVGIFSSISSGFIADLMRAYEQRHTDVRLDFIEGSPREHLSAIRHFKLDIAFLTGPFAPPDCEGQHLWTERVFVVLPEADKLANLAEIAWNDLRNRHFIVSRSDPGPEIHDFLVKHLSLPGYHPSVEYCAVGRDNLMQLVSLGKGLTLTSEATTGTKFPRVVYRLLAGEALPFCAIWSPKNDNPALRRLLSLARVMARRNSLCNSSTHRAMAGP